MRLRDLMGQDRATMALTRALVSGHLSHAYLFDGPEGVGKTTAARALGLALTCAQEPNAGCGSCDTCRRVLGGLHPDVRIVAPPATGQLVVDQVQEIVALAATRPHEAPARLIIVAEADRMNVAASNCLLKTLEEPARGNHIVLVTALPDRLLPTIRSRTQRVRFAGVKASLLVELAVARGAERARAEAAAAVAGGSVARVLELCAADEQGGNDASLWDSVSRLRAAAGGRDQGVAALFGAAADLGGDKEGKEVLPQTLALLGSLYRDALAQAVDAPDLVLLRERQTDLDRLAGDGSLQVRRRLVRAVGAVFQAHTVLAANVNAVAALEGLMLDLRSIEGDLAR